MRFWDSSSIVPLCLEQPTSRRARDLLREDGEMVAWWASPVECSSAFARLRRDGVLNASDEEQCLRILRKLQSAWHEIVPMDQVRLQAQRILRLHPLRAADALQLAAAREWAGAPSSGQMVTFDSRLAHAARMEGFEVPSLGP